MPTLWLIPAFLRRDWAIARSYRLAFVLDAVDSLVYLALFFYLGRVVDQSEIASRTELSEGYFAFAAIGLALMRVMQSGLTSFALQLRRDQTTGTLEALLVTPAPQSLVILGSTTYDLLNATVSGLVLVGLAIGFFGLHLTIEPSSVLVLLAAIPASLMLFAALGIAIAAFTVVFKEVTALLALVTTGLAVFVRGLLPGWGPACRFGRPCRGATVHLGAGRSSGGSAERGCFHPEARRVGRFQRDRRAYIACPLQDGGELCQASGNTGAVLIRIRRPRSMVALGPPQ
jgi:ABC-type transport system involved in cytochrome c biogenesis permease component